MAATVSVSREVSAPADVLWAMVADVGRMGEWSPETTKGHWFRRSAEPRVGSRFVGVNRNGKRIWATVCKVVAYEPGRVFAFDATVGPFTFATWRYDFEPTADGTLVTETWTGPTSRVLNRLGWVVSGVTDRRERNQATMTVTLERLAAVATA